MKQTGVIKSQHFSAYCHVIN